MLLLLQPARLIDDDCVAHSSRCVRERTVVEAGT